MAAETNPTDPAPLEEALHALRLGETPRARQILGILPSRMSDAALLDCMVAIDQALDLLREQRHPEANERLQHIRPLIDATDNKDLRDTLITYTHLTEDVTRLLRGDAAGAVEHLQALATEFERITFFAPRMAKVASATRAWAYIALSRAAMSAGDLNAAEDHFRTVRTEQDRLMTLLDPDDPADLPGIVEIRATRVEMAAALVMLDLQVLDLDSAEARIGGTKPDADALQPLVARLPENALQFMASAVLRILQAITDLAAIERELLFERRPTSRQRLNRFQSVAHNLVESVQLASRAGQRGAGYLSMLRQLDRLRAGLLNADRIRRQDFGRYAGLVSVAALVIVLAAIRLTVNPSGIAAVGFFIGALIVALVAGFGYGALRFAPLLQLYTQVASGEANPAGEGNATTGSDTHH